MTFYSNLSDSDLHALKSISNVFEINKNVNAKYYIKL